MCLLQYTFQNLTKYTKESKSDFTHQTAHKKEVSFSVIYICNALTKRCLYNDPKHQNTHKNFKFYLFLSTFCLVCCRKELSELWNSHNQLTDHSSQQADLIRQLQSLQHDTQKSKCIENCQNKLSG